MAQYNLGRCFPVVKGNFMMGDAYVMLDIVYNPADGCSYICKQDNMDAPVTNTKYWMKISERGVNGKDGIDGKDGAPGKQGPVGPQGPKGDKGIDGIDGKDGAPGKQGPVGPQGPKGDKGDPGKNGVSPDDVISIVETKDYATNTSVKDLNAKVDNVESKIPVKVSQLTNDVDYLTVDSAKKNGFAMMWYGTQEEYDSIVNYDPNTIYNIIEY